MSAHRADRPRRFAALVGVLVLLAGSNYCLVAGLAGVPMACLGLAQEAAAMPAGHCAAAAKAAEHADHRTPADAADLPPCCVVLVSTVTPTVACPPADATPLAFALPLVHAIELAAQPLEPAADESPPPLRSTPEPLRGRAPPLA